MYFLLHNNLQCGVSRREHTTNVLMLTRHFISLLFVFLLMD
jgi:hypothetical protein